MTRFVFLLVLFLLFMSSLYSEDEDVVCFGGLSDRIEKSSNNGPYTVRDSWWSFVENGEVNYYSFRILGDVESSNIYYYESENNLYLLTGSADRLNLLLRNQMLDKDESIKVITEYMPHLILSLTTFDRGVLIDKSKFGAMKKGGYVSYQMFICKRLLGFSFLNKSEFECFLDEQFGKVGSFIDGNEWVVNFISQNGDNSLTFWRINGTVEPFLVSGIENSEIVPSASQNLVPSMDELIRFSKDQTYELSE